jgi:hypothetical protein
MKPSERKPVFKNGVFVGFTGDPGTFGAITHRRPRPYVYKRRTGPLLHGLGALGVADRHNTFPDKVGAPGNPFQGDYDEYSIWGTNSPTDGVIAPTDPLTAVQSVEGPQEFDPGISLPFGISIIAWRNPTTMQSVPINASTTAILPVLSLNMQRNSLIVQNNSFVTVSTDAIPTFYIGFNAQPQVGLSLALVGGAGILFDIICPRDSIYITVAGGGASQVIQGVVVQGTYAPV